MTKINYRKISNWALATDFYHTWREMFTLLKNNSNDFYIWHPFYNMNLELKCINVEKYMSAIFEINGVIANEFEEHVRNIKFKRNKKKIKRNNYENTPSFIITHSFEKYPRYSFSKPTITHTDSIRIPSYDYGSNIDMFVSTIESLFDRINLKDKKKIYLGIERWRKKKDKWALISFWKCINEIFNIEFSLTHNIDANLKDTKTKTYYKGKLYIDTKEHYIMQIKSIKFLMNKRKEEMEQMNKK